MLTELKIRGLKSKNKEYPTSDSNGLSIYTTSKGVKKWRYRYRCNRKASMISLGKYPAVSLSEARKQRDIYQKALFDGINPKTYKDNHRKNQQNKIIDFSVSDDDLKFFKENGFLYIKNYYDVDKVIVPLLRDIYKLINLVLADQNIFQKQAPFSIENFDKGLIESLTEDRNLARIIYDSVKKLPRFSALVNDFRNRDVASVLLNTDFPGFALRGYGARMDFPKDTYHKTPLHQDYIAQLCSPRGIVFWSPLRKMSRSLGPIVLYPGSHKAGIYPVKKGEKNDNYLKIKDSKLIESKYQSFSPELELGDMIILDYLMLHKSSLNTSDKTRWSFLFRYFDFNEPIGKSYGWKGGDQEGNSFEDFHKDYVIPK